MYANPNRTAWLVGQIEARRQQRVTCAAVQRSGNRCGRHRARLCSAHRQPASLSQDPRTARYPVLRAAPLRWHSRFVTMHSVVFARQSVCTQRTR